jgi:2-keto-4-pentenoate hydratase/2-oxohepta-3-ene-1,7-dioic acid hydratase in catechol pathway
MSFQRLVRFVNDQGATQYGDLKSEPTGDLTGQEVEVLEGDLDSGFKSTGRTEKIQKLLAPLPKVPIVMCIGLNYQHHADEAKVRLMIFLPPALQPSCPPQKLTMRSISSKCLRFQSCSPNPPTLWRGRTTTSPSTRTPKSSWITRAR